MSRIGKKPIPIPANVDVQLSGQMVTAKGPKGALKTELSSLVQVLQKDNALHITPKDDSQMARKFWGLSRSLVANIIEGVAHGFSKTLELQGIGYRAQMQGKVLKLTLGFSHDIDYSIPDGIEVSCPSQTEIVVSGIDRQKVGQVAAEIKNYRPPEPYKGKGVRYSGEYVFRKEGKKK